MNNTNENSIKQIPALQTLIKLGYTYLPTHKYPKKQALLEDILARQLHKLNEIFYRKKKYPINDENIFSAIKKLRILFKSSNPYANEKIYDVITFPQPYTQLIEGKQRKFGLVYIDWANWENNVYHCTSQKDIILYINGIPLAILPCKSPENKTVYELYQQKGQYLPNLSPYIRLLFSNQSKNKNDVLLQALAKLNLLFREPNDEMYNYELDHQTLKVCEEGSPYIADIIEQNFLPKYPVWSFDLTPEER